MCRRHQSHADCCCSHCSATTTATASHYQLPTADVVQNVSSAFCLHHYPDRSSTLINRNNVSVLLPFFVPLIMLIMISASLHTVQCNPTTVWETVVAVDRGDMDTAHGSNDGKFLFAAVAPVDQLFPRERRAHRISEATALHGLGWRKRRYYVNRWGAAASGGGERRRAGRRFVPTMANSEQSVDRISEHDDEAVAKQRLCGLKLTARTKQLCGDCVPANMRQVILLDKKHGGSSSSNSRNSQAFSKERLTEMCCVHRCTDEQIRNFCCRGRT